MQIAQQEADNAGYLFIKLMHVLASSIPVGLIVLHIRCTFSLKTSLNVYAVVYHFSSNLELILLPET